MFNFDEASKKSKEAMDGMLKSYSDLTRGYQAIAAETTDYSKKSFMDMSAFMEQLASTRSMETAYELQTNYVKSAYEGFVAQATRMSEMYADLAKSAYKPYEAPVVMAPKAVVPTAA